MNLVRRNYLLFALMLLAALLAHLLRPLPPDPSSFQEQKLEALIPEAFGDWRLLAVDTVTLVNAQQQETLDRIYSQVLSRTYENVRTRERVMLSIAYGGVQSKSTQVHRPEVCYPAQGFQILEDRSDSLDSNGFGTIPVKRLLARQGARVEPITYWIRIGDFLARGAMEQKYAAVLQGLSGQVASGMLFRVSSIGVDTAKAYRAQDSFVVELLKAQSPDARAFLLGKQGD